MSLVKSRTSNKAKVAEIKERSKRLAETDHDGNLGFFSNLDGKLVFLYILVFCTKVLS